MAQTIAAPESSAAKAKRLAAEAKSGMANTTTLPQLITQVQKLTDCVASILSELKKAQEKIDKLTGV